MRSREFELPELKLLIDAVSSSRFVTKSKSEELVTKLSRLASHQQAQKLVRQIYTADRLKPGNENIFKGRIRIYGPKEVLGEYKEMLEKSLTQMSM